MSYEQRVMDINKLVPTYKTVHFAIPDNNLYSPIACKTPHANICSSNPNDVTCGRCLRTDAYNYCRN